MDPSQRHALRPGRRSELWKHPWPAREPKPPPRSSSVQATVPRRAAPDSPDQHPKRLHFNTAEIDGIGPDMQGRDYRFHLAGKPQRCQIEGQVLLLPAHVQNHHHRLVFGAPEIRQHLGVIRVERDVGAIEQCPVGMPEVQQPSMHLC